MFVAFSPTPSTGSNQSKGIPIAYPGSLFGVFLDGELDDNCASSNQVELREFRIRAGG